MQQRNQLIVGTAWLTCVAMPALAQNSAGQIDEMLVLGQAYSGLTATGSRLELTLRETPATLDVINGDLVRSRLDLTVLESVTRSAGFSAAGNPGNGGTSVTARGFTGQDAVTKLYDGNHYFTLAGTITFPFDTWAVDRLEVLKGPASVLYGHGGVAGAYNLVPKTPTAEQEFDIRLSAGNDDLRFIGLSANGQLADNWVARADYSQSQADGWVVGGNSDSQMVALATSWQVSDRLQITARYDQGKQNPMRYFGIPVVNNDFVDGWTGLNFNAGDSQISYDDDMARLIAKWTISDKMHFSGEVFSMNTDRYWQNVETYIYDSVNDLVERWDPLIIRHEMSQQGIRGSLVFQHNLGQMAWKSSIGIETSALDMKYSSNFNPSHPDRVDWANDFDSVDPNNLSQGLWSDVSDSLAALDQVSDVTQTALFGETQLKLTDNLALVAGLRYDRIETDYERLTYLANGQRDTSQDNSLNQRINPLMTRLGFVYDWSTNTALYGQISTGETHPNGGDIVRVRNNLSEAKTVTVRQAEVGMKQLVGNSLVFNFALFDINKQNMRIDDPTNPDPTVFTLVREQRARGAEVGFNYAVTDSLLTYLNAAYVNSERDTGTRFVATDYVPQITANTGLIFRPMDSVRIGLDYRFVDQRPFGATPLANYSVVDASIGWDASQSLRISLHGKNLFDELYASADHWTGGQWSVGQPRSFSLTADWSL